MIDYKSSFKLPFQDVMKYIIGIALSILPIINFFALGYILETARLSMKTKFILPEWKKPGRLFLDGFFATIITIVYFLPVLIVLFIGNYSFISTNFLNLLYETAGEQLGEQIFAQLGPLLFTFIFLAIVAAYLLPAAILVFADTGKFGHAFNLIRVINISFSKHYFGPWIISIACMILIYVIAISIIPYIGLAIASFTTGIITYSILAQAYANAKHHI